MLKRFSGVTTILRATYFLGVTTCSAIFSCLEARYSDSLASVSPSVHAADTLTRSRSFTDIQRPSSSNDKCSKSTNRGACIEAARIGSTCTRDTCSGDGYIGNTSAGGACARSACIKGVCIETTSIWDVGSEGIDARVAKRADVKGP